MVFDATMKSATGALNRIDAFKDSYAIHGYYMFASPETATTRAMSRFKRGNEKNGKGRFVPPEIVMGNTENEKNFDKAIESFDKWGVYDNNSDSGSGPVHVASGSKGEK